MRQLLSGVAKLHARGVVHRDLKSLNIAIESSDNPFSVVILDFDLASTNPNGVMRTVCGTQGYFAPEIYDRDKTSRKPVGYSSKVDVWSLGMVFLEAIRPDFAKELHGECATHEYNGTPAGFSLNHYVRFVNKELTRLDGNVQLSQGEKKIIKAMLDANPKNRVTAAQCLEYACDIGLFRKSNEGEFIYEAGRGPITDSPVLPVEENLATIAEHAQEDDSAPPAAEAGPCYNIPSEATTHQESGNNTPRATECDTPQVFVSCVEEIDDTQGEEEPDEYSPAPSGSRAPLHPDFFQPSDYRGSYYVETPRFVESEAVRVLPDEKDNVTPHPIEMLPETPTAFGWDDETPQVNELDDETSPAIETDAGYEASVEPSSTAGSDDSFVGTTAADAPGQSVKASTDTSSRVSGDELASFVEHQSEIVCGGDHNHEDQTDNASTGSAVQNLIHVELESSSWKRRAPDDDEGSTTDAQAGSTKRVKVSL
jgi:serine/threonine protein kinase